MKMSNSILFKDIKISLKLLHSAQFIDILSCLLGEFALFNRILSVVRHASSFHCAVLSVILFIKKNKQGPKLSKGSTSSNTNTNRCYGRHIVDVCSYQHQYVSPWAFLTENFVDFQ